MGFGTFFQKVRFGTIERGGDFTFSKITAPEFLVVSLPLTLTGRNPEIHIDNYGVLMYNISTTHF
jgi:hypothetical protein